MTPTLLMRIKYGLPIEKKLKKKLKKKKKKVRIHLACQLKFFLKKKNYTLKTLFFNYK
jgi:hypothetical protein